MKRSNHLSLKKEQRLDSLVTSLKCKLENLPPLPSECCIYKVPKRLRDANTKAYSPQIVSIGPFHHNAKGLKAMEERYLGSFLTRINVSLESYVKLVKESEQRVRNHYDETFKLSTDNFVKIILLDAAFVIELLLRNHFQKIVDEHDPIFNKPRKIRDIKFDMMLLENQLPFFIFEDIFAQANICIPPYNNTRTSLIRLTHSFFIHKGYLGQLEMKEILEKLHSSTISHFLDFLRKCHARPEKVKQQHKSKIKALTIPCATELQAAGVKFQVGSSRNLFDMQFRNGILEIPHLRIRSSTEIFFRNLVAFEDCHFLDDSYVSDYVFIVDRLIDTTKDVELLLEKGIIETKLPDSQGVADFINNLARGTILLKKNFYFADLCEDLNAYCRYPWHKWKATLKHDYFGTPWAVLSITAAAILLILTIIQTVCSVISL